MFLCDKCHKAEEDICPGHITASWGRCEVCGADGRCVDCTAYKRLTLDELKARVKRREAAPPSKEGAP